MIRPSPQRRATLQRVVFPILVLSSLTAVILGKADQVMFESLRAYAADAIAPALDVLSRPLAATAGLAGRVHDTIAVYQQNARLRDDNEKLLHWQQTALRLSSENAELRALLKLAPEPPSSYVTARVIANSGGAFVRSVMINAGGEDGVARGQAAVTGEGLVGRVAEVGSRASRILLVTDLNSRVPVIVEGPRERAVLAGDNSARPALRYLEPSAAVQIGDRVVTSGEGGVFPPGLPVGVVAAIDHGVSRVEPYVELSNVVYLRVVDYGLAMDLPDPVRIAPRGPRHAAPAGEAARR